MVQTTVLGYPRIGARRELKRATEKYWSGDLGPSELEAAGAQLRKEVWLGLREAGIDLIPSNTFSMYDHMLDTAVLFGAVPARFHGLEGNDHVQGLGASAEQYFAMARGTEGVPPLEMTKWFDTNYHYLVPELEPGTRFTLDPRKPIGEYLEAKELGIETRPVVPGPLTFLLLSKGSGPDGWTPLELLDPLLDQYVELLHRLADLGAGWIQIDEPILAGDRTAAELDALRTAYDRLGSQAARPKIVVTCSYGSLGDALGVLDRTPIEGIGIDLVAGQDTGILLDNKVLYAGLVDGHNVWRTDLPSALAKAAALLGSTRELVVSTSCSLLHVPLDLELEQNLEPDLLARLAFAKQKVAEVGLLGRALTEGREVIADADAGAGASADRTAGAAGATGVAGATPVDPRVRARLESIGDGRARTTFQTRFEKRPPDLPLLPTTTIGSFPQTKQIRRARADLRAGRIDTEAYNAKMRKEIDQVIALQEDLGLDVLVHGEPERNDMVQYFAEQLQGYTSTEHGWVQSYGTRYVRPPILYADVSRPEPMTVEWTTYAQSRTTKPVKGMLTGPVTMLAWSFVRDDQPLADTARQVALALRDEIRDLESAGITHIQLDEPALREKLPLRKADQADYLQWATAAFRLATGGVADSTQIHTHMCYSEFGEIVDAIDGLDADVTSVEAARSSMELVEDLRRVGYEHGIGPGVYDIHSPRVPTIDEIETGLLRALNAIDPAKLWVNPDCGLKTRAYDEVVPALRNLVEATRRVRAKL